MRRRFNPAAIPVEERRCTPAEFPRCEREPQHSKSPGQFAEAIGVHRFTGAVHDSPRQNCFHDLLLEMSRRRR